MKIAVTLSVVYFLVGLVNAQNGILKEKDAIGFPETEENPKLQNKENRKPVYLPSTCSENELYYPGDQKDDWICDCRPAHIYHPASDKCWPAFQRGPCNEGYYLVLPANSVLPECQKNPCYADGYVLWNGKCERIGSVNPCSFLYPTSAALGVNATTMVVSCVRLSVDLGNRFGEDTPTVTNVTVPTVPDILCPAGSKRSFNGTCIAERIQ